MTHSGKTKIVFFGSGPVAARCLELLIPKFEIEAVITKPRPPHHKYDVPVLSMSERHDLPTLLASDRKELNILVASHKFESQIAILIDFGIIVSRQVIDTFPLGIINSHFSLLPLWRGADPITFAVLNGDEKTGVSLMIIDEGMDTGKLLTSRSLHLDDGETSITLTDRLIELSDQLIEEYVPRYVAGDLEPKNQPHPDRVTYSRKLTKEDGLLDWNEPADVIERKIRAYQPWPKCHGQIGNWSLIITKAHVSDTKHTPLDMTCGDGLILCIDEVIAPSGKKMPADAFLRGYAA